MVTASTGKTVVLAACRPACPEYRQHRGTVLPQQLRERKQGEEDEEGIGVAPACIPEQLRDADQDQKRNTAVFLDPFLR